MNYDHLFKWELLATDSQAIDDTCFLDFEKNMAEHGIRTRVLINDKGSGYTLWVPLKDYPVAHALFTGEVRAVIDSHKELYHVFEDDLTFKNKVLYQNKYSSFIKKNKYGSILLLGAILFVMLMMFRFVKFL